MTSSAARSVGARRVGARYVSAMGITALAGLTVSADAFAQSTAPNILMFYVDDLRHDGLGITGHEFVQTPNIDQRIGGQGVNFLNSFSSTPVCSPSRASLFTGQYAATHGLLTNDNPNPTPDERLPVYQLALQDAGYRTGLIGKWHMDSYLGARPGFDYWAAFQGQGTHTDVQLLVKDGNGPSSIVNEAGFTTTVLTDYAVDFLDDYGTGGARSEPFALTLSFKAVHAPFGDAETESGTLYNGQTSSRPPSATPEYGGYDMGEEKPVFGRPGFSQPTLNNTKGNAQQESQMEMLHDIDTQIGRVLDTLEARGLADNTLIVFTSDNGYFWGEHGRGDKRAVYEESIRVPLLMRGPGIQQGVNSTELVTNLDVAPTILQAAGLSVPGSMQGSSLLPVMNGTGTLGRDSIYTEYYQEDKFPEVPTWDAVRTQTHLYVNYNELGPQYDELYDLVNDPYQLNNLLQPGGSNLNSQTQTLLADMQQRLQQKRIEANSVNAFTRVMVDGSSLDFVATDGGNGRLLNSTSMRVGANTNQPNNGTGRAAVLAYEIPVLDDPTLLERAFVSFHLIDTVGNLSNARADLWAIGITQGASPLSEYLEAQNELSLADRLDNVKLQDNILTAGTHLGRTFSDADAAVILAEYLRLFYEANPGYTGGSFLQVRLNPDSDLGNTSIGWNISAIEALDPQGDPFYFRQSALVLEVTIPEPGLAAMGLAGLLMLKRRGCRGLQGCLEQLALFTSTRARRFADSASACKRGSPRILPQDALESHAPSQFKGPRWQQRAFPAPTGETSRRLN